MYEAADAVGVSAAGAEILRIGHCAIVSLPAAGLAARVARPGYPSDRLGAEIRFALHLHDAGIPVLRPAVEVAERPIETRQGPVTFWPLLRPLAGSIDWPWLGRTLRRLHELQVPARIVSLWDPVGLVEERLAAYAAAPEKRVEYVSALSAVCTRSRETLSIVSSVADGGLIHGDPANVIMTEDGPLLLDFDLSGVGPAEWDLVSIAFRCRRFGLADEELRAFSGAYGFDVRLSPHFEALLRVRELLDCSFALALGRTDRHAQEELDVRMRAWLHPHDRSPWTPLGSPRGASRIDCEPIP